METKLQYAKTTKVILPNGIKESSKNKQISKDKYYIKSSIDISKKEKDFIKPYLIHLLILDLKLFSVC